MTPQEVPEDEPFEPGVPVYKVAGKVLAILQRGRRDQRHRRATSHPLQRQFPAAHSPRCT